MTYLSPLLNILTKSLRIVGKSVIRDYTEIEKLQNSIKNNKNFIIKAEESLKKKLSEALEKIKPNLPIEKINENKLSNCWLLETIDNKINFSRGLQDFCICVSLKENKEITTSVFYDPIRDETFFFQKGFGGYKNDLKIRVSEKKKISESIFSIFKKFSKDDDIEAINIIRKNLGNKSVETRETGSITLDLCNVGCGKYDGLLFANPCQNHILISSLISKETGGIINTLEYKESSIYISSNEYIGKILKEVIKNENEKN